MKSVASSCGALYHCGAFRCRQPRETRSRQRRICSSEALEGRALLSIYPVTNLHDSGAGSLRDAIDPANAIPGADTITFQPGLTGTITLTSAELQIGDVLTIGGLGVGALSISGNHANRIFDIQNHLTGKATISGLLLRDGSAVDGGAIYSDQCALNLTDCMIFANTATARGGGIFSGASLALVNCAFLSNTADAAGGVYHESPNITGCTFWGNTATTDGGALYGGGTLTNDTFANNTAVSGGGL